MASIERVMEQRMNQIKKIINTGLKIILGEEIRETIIYYLENNFYSMGYGNRGELAKSIHVDVEMDSSNSFVVTVYFDDEKIRHRSWFGSESLGISDGDISYTVGWVNDGWSYIHGSRDERLRDRGLEPNFMEDALDDLERNRGWLEKFYDYLRSNGIEIQKV